MFEVILIPAPNRRQTKIKYFPNSISYNTNTEFEFPKKHPILPFSAVSLFVPHTVQQSIMEYVDCKKQRLECSTDLPVSTLMANDVVILQFIDNSSVHVCRPEFTHQIFENERIDYIESSHETARITIEVNCKDLSHIVEFSESFAESERQQLTRSLQKVLPPDAIRKDDISSNKVNSTITPPGVLIHTFTSKASSNDRKQELEFEMYLATAKDAGASELLVRAESLAMWYIETADSVDFSDDRWEVLFLYFKAGNTANAGNSGADEDSAHSNSQTSCSRSFAGYMTLFSFRNPFLGTKVRVCQALVLPHQQSRGLGRELLRCAYKQVVLQRPEVSELTVEDPAPGFQRLRDAVDFELLAESFPVAVAVVVPVSISSGGNNPAAATVDSREVVGATSAEDDAIATASLQLKECEVCRKLKIVKAQAQFLLEALDYFAIVRKAVLQLQQSVSSSTAATSVAAADIADQVESGGNGNTEANGTATKKRNYDSDGFKRKLQSAKAVLDAHPDFKAFRLKVKRRILKNDKDLASITPKSEMQRALSEEFELQLERFQALESSAVRIGVLRAQVVDVI